MTKAGRVGLVTCLVVAVLAVAVAVYVLRIALSDHYTFGKNDIAYFLVVTSPTIRDFPRFTSAGEPLEFTYQARDGTSPSQITLSYNSQEPVETLHRNYHRHCVDKGYPVVARDQYLRLSDFGCDAPDYRIEALFRKLGAGNFVTAVFLER